MEFSCPSCGGAVGVLAVREGRAHCPSCGEAFVPSLSRDPAVVPASGIPRLDEDKPTDHNVKPASRSDTKADVANDSAANVKPSDRTEAVARPASRRDDVRNSAFRPPASSSSRHKRISGKAARQQIISALEQAGPYEVVGEVARGGMGIVFKARDRHLRRLVAIKVLRGDSGDPDEIRRFRREAEAAAKLQHSNIVPIHAVGEVDGRPFFVMDFIEGQGLNDLIKAGELSPRAALDIAEQTAEALHYAHLQGVVHRDLKPANIIIDRLGRPQVMDFGLAKQIDDDQSLTKTGTTMGTPAYMPPEQAEGDLKAIDESSDVYSLGAVLYEMLTGQAPFSGTSTMNVLMKVLEEEPEAPRRINPRIHKDIETICLKAMSKEKDQRYASALELAEDVRRFRAGEAISAAPASLVYRLRKWLSRSWQVAGLMAAVVLFFTGLTAYVLITGYREARQRRADEDAQIGKLMDLVVSRLQRFRAIRSKAKENWRREARKVLAKAEDDTRMVLLLRPDHTEAVARLDEVRSFIEEVRVMEFNDLAYNFIDEEQFLAAEKLFRIVLEDYDPHNRMAKRGLELAQGVGRLFVTTAPPGVQVSLVEWGAPAEALGAALGTTPLDGVDARIGTYRMTLQSDLVGKHELPLKVSRGAEIRMEAVGLPSMGGAGDDMVLVPAGEVVLPGGRRVRLAAFAIDRYESGASLGEIPRHDMSWVEATAACRERAKRLCSFHEWKRACGGNEGLAFPYGAAFDPSVCWSGVEGPGAAGGRFRCVSPWGVFDMSGNVGEWVGPTRSEAVVYGGDWSLTQGAFLGCGSDSPLPATKKGPRVGFRCCKGDGATGLQGADRGVTPSLAGRPAPKVQVAPVAVCPSDMVEVPGGEFAFDTGFGDRQTRSVTGFCIDRYEFPGRAGGMPQRNVTWMEATRLCRDRGRRLCTPLEWQRACRGPNDFDFPYGGRYLKDGCRSEVPNQGPEASGARATCKSGFGVHDMSGNVAEWLADPNHPGVCEIAGGSYASGRFETRCAYRDQKPRSFRGATVGFRCCATLRK